MKSQRFVAVMVASCVLAGQVRAQVAVPTPRTVSYTHLDVYKRQAATRASSSVIPSRAAAIRALNSTVFARSCSSLRAFVCGSSALISATRGSRRFTTRSLLVPKTFVRTLLPIKMIPSSAHRFNADILFFDFTGRRPGAPTTAGSLANRNSPKHCGAMPQNCALPVSYTHLDVYKRQRSPANLSSMSLIRFGT